MWTETPPSPRKRDSLLAGLETFRRLHPGVTVNEAIVFLYVCENEGLTVSELAFIAGLNSATASRVVRSLTPPGSAGALPPSLNLVELRVTGPKRNSKSAYLTEGGRALRDRLNAIILSSIPILPDTPAQVA